MPRETVRFCIECSNPYDVPVTTGPPAIVCGDRCRRARINRQSAARNRRLRSERRRAIIREAVAAEVAAILADRERPSAA